MLAAEMGEKLSSIEKVATRLHSEREELASHMENQSSTIAQWALNERQLVDPIRDTATCIENCTSSLRTLVCGEGVVTGCVVTVVVVVVVRMRTIPIL